MNLASPSLVRYLQRVDLPTSNSCECFVSGVAAYLAVESWACYITEECPRRPLPGGEWLDVAPAPSRSAQDAAHFFAGGLVAKYQEVNTASLAAALSLEFVRMFPEAGRDSWLRGDWASELGWCVALEADGAGVAWSDKWPDHRLSLPYLECCDDFFVNDDAV